ncbi:branched-chain amino acid transport system II carrier protein [Flavobacterium sp. JP2137]|uniref:branched-chain amino acid transport system II carrier protein n=1 Tax=Flavobacterium sp. JP2137 TaxID=3414510 RepID=UPI003D30041C
MRSKKIIDALTIGFALFAMFFGAGNLILPPTLGLQAGTDWLASISGFTITAIIAPFLGIVAVLFSGETFTDLGGRINKYFAVILAVVIMLSIGPLVAIPRTAATTFEVGVLAIAPGFNPIVSSIIFFAITLTLSISPSRVVDIIGQFLTPLLLVLLTVLVVAGIWNPATIALGDQGGTAEAFLDGFREGYQTMDVLASVIFASIIITAAKAKGYTSDKAKVKITIVAGLVAMFCLLFIYGGLVYLGATSGFDGAQPYKRSDLLLYISQNLLGTSGTAALSLCIALACLTTAIALTCAVGTFFSDLTKGKLSYRLVVILTCVSSSILAVRGVDEIIDYAFTFLAVVYPITLAMVLYVVLFGKVIFRRAPFIGAVGATTVIALMEFSERWGFQAECIGKIKSWIPLHQYELAWVVPSLVFFALFYLGDLLLFPQRQK